jgi:hypothetical protein
MPRRQLLFVVPQKVTKKGTKGGDTMHLSADVSPPLESPSQHRIFCGGRSPSQSRLRRASSPEGRATRLRRCFLHRLPCMRNSATHLFHTNEQRRSRVLPPSGNSPVRGNVAKRQRGLLPLLRGSAEGSEAKGGLATPPQGLRRRI